MRLIDADHLRKWIIANWHSGWHHKTVDDILDQIDREDTYIEDADIVDVEPIIHGHWIKVETPHTFPYELSVYKCSECDTYLFAVVDGYRYCPNCGAKMDEVEEDGN